MNKIQKGNKAEKDVANILLSREYVIMSAQRKAIRIGPNRWKNKKIDFYGLYDILAKHQFNDNLYVQVKSNTTDVYKVMPKIAKFHEKYNHDEISEIWLRVTNKGFVIWRYNDVTKLWDKRFIKLSGIECDPFIYANKKVKKSE